ncbi:hypothetical protein, partial [Vagococcus fluvialis]
MKKYLLFIIVFSFFLLPLDVKAESGRRLDEVIGEFGYSIIGNVGDNMVDLKEKEKYLGQKLIEGYKGRMNDLNDIFNGALSFEGGDTGSQTWDKVVDFVFPVEKEKVEIKATPDFKKTLANVIINMPEKVDMASGGFKYLGSYNGELGYGGRLEIPFNYTYIENTNSKFVEIRVVNTSKYPLENQVSYYHLSEKFKNVSKDKDVYIYETGIIASSLNYNYSPDKVDFTVDLTNHSKREFNYINIKHDIPLIPLGVKHKLSAEVYYSFGNQTIVVKKGDIINKTYNNNNHTVNDIINLIDSRVPDNAVVNHEIGKGYKNYDDYNSSERPDKESGILGKLIDFIASIPSMLLDLIELLFDLIMKVIHLLIPTSEQISSMGDKVNEISENFKGKFKIVTDLSNDFKVA